VVIDESHEVSLLTCTGDTAVGRFLDLSFVRETRVLAIECTFFDLDHRMRASQGRHIHVNDIPGILEAVPEAHVLLIHVTHRTDIRQAKRILQKVIKPGDVERVSFLMDRPPRGIRLEPPADPEGHGTAPAAPHSQTPG
jgi:ribonuclease BN (tRNA processing enzyme)